MTDFHFVPAAAGYYALWRSDVAPGYGRTIITAWQIDTAPVTHVSGTSALIEGDNGTPIEAILCPDGTVQAVDSGDFWPDIVAWQASLRKAA